MSQGPRRRQLAHSGGVREKESVRDCLQKWSQCAGSPECRGACKGWWEPGGLPAAGLQVQEKGRYDSRDSSQGWGVMAAVWTATSRPQRRKAWAPPLPFRPPCGLLLERPMAELSVGSLEHTCSTQAGSPEGRREQARGTNRCHPGPHSTGGLSEPPPPSGFCPCSRQGHNGTRARESATFSLSGGYCKRRFSLFFVNKTMKPP